MRKLKSILFLTLGLALLASGPAVQAAPLGFHLSGAVGVWYASPGGSADGLSLDSDFDMGNSFNLDLWARFEHPVPLVPDVKLEYTPIKLDGDKLSSDLDLKLLDLTAYWHIPLLNTLSAGVLDVTFGLGARVYDSQLSYDRPLAGSISPSAKGTLPFLYVGGRVSPLEMFALVAEFRGFSYDDNDTFDAVAKVEYFPFGKNFFVGGGYRYLTLQNDKSEQSTQDLKLDVNLGGFFLETGFSF